MSCNFWQHSRLELTIPFISEADLPVETGAPLPTQFRHGPRPDILFKDQFISQLLEIFAQSSLLTVLRFVQSVEYLLNLVLFF